MYLLITESLIVKKLIEKNRYIKFRNRNKFLKFTRNIPKSEFLYGINTEEEFNAKKKQMLGL